MKEIGNMISMSENAPPMIAPLLNLLKYHENTPFDEQLMLGTAPDIPSLHDHTNSSLKHLR